MAIAAADRGPFTSEQMAHIRAALDALDRGADAFCTGCRYCLPCPQGIAIPEIMGQIARRRFYGDETPIDATPGPADCTACGLCETRCTQHLPISAEMAGVASRV